MSLLHFLVAAALTLSSALLCLPIGDGPQTTLLNLLLVTTFLYLFGKLLEVADYGSCGARRCIWSWRRWTRGGSWSRSVLFCPGLGLKTRARGKTDWRTSGAGRRALSGFLKRQDEGAG
ncbi:uncharacterized protein BDZ99DRAFT_479933 [Mytilinidion resinicola]|uniref:Uncharacterized protein n=1 Tax=Mytilinidion resinicola TaxID=574789 RepID=A0A6A6YAR2_9PEZI|nr:uncharacterized protein BDZ99DRAFT_479933 [Mytilinidion resinicola]KAF2805911.1 hypothetical protein BDZ99DRAFT_479933 [Mytilinidion resinicola]